MLARSYLLWAISPLCCFLTVAASGDGFCLLRLVVASAVDVAGECRPDQANRDFISTTGEGGRSVADAGHRLDLVAAGAGDRAASATVLFPSTFEHEATCRTPQRTGRTPPLRC